MYYCNILEVYSMYYCNILEVYCDVLTLSLRTSAVLSTSPWWSISLGRR